VLVHIIIASRLPVIVLGRLVAFAGVFLDVDWFKLFILIFCQAIGVRQLWMLIVIRLQCFLGVKKLLEGLPIALLPIILPENQELPSYYFSIMVLLFATVSDIDIDVYWQNS
jgi:hypothetical protein